MHRQKQKQQIVFYIESNLKKIPKNSFFFLKNSSLYFKRYVKDAKVKLLSIDKIKIRYVTTTRYWINVRYSRKI